MRTLRTARLQLRALKAAELAEVNAASNGPAASTLSDEAVRWMERMGTNSDPRLGGGWSFRHGVTHRLIGLCLYFSSDPSGDAAEISYIVPPPYRSRAYCTEAMTAIVGDLFEKVGFSRLYADVATDNPASLRVLAKLSFIPGDPGAGTVVVGVDHRPARRHHLDARDYAFAAGASVDDDAGRASALTSP